MRVGLIKAVPVKWDLEHNWRVVEGLTVTFIQFGPVRYYLLVLTMAVLFAISLKDVKYGI